MICDKCIYLEEDELYDEEEDDYILHYRCEKEVYADNEEIEEEIETCSFFKEYKENKYEEKDTKCDSCEIIKDVHRIETTILQDIRRHFIGGCEFCIKECNDETI